MPFASNRSLRIGDFRPSLTSTNSASSIRQPLPTSGVCIMPFTGMGSIAKVLRSQKGAVFSHHARKELLCLRQMIRLGYYRHFESKLEGSLLHLQFVELYFSVQYESCYSQCWRIASNAGNQIHILGYYSCLKQH